MNDGSREARGGKVKAAFASLRTALGGELSRSLSLFLLAWGVFSIFSIHAEDAQALFFALCFLVFTGIFIRMLSVWVWDADYSTSLSIGENIARARFADFMHGSGDDSRDPAMLARVDTLLVELDGVFTDDSPVIARVLSLEDLKGDAAKRYRGRLPLSGDALDALEWAHMSLEGSSDPISKVVANALALESVDLAKLHKNFARNGTLAHDEIAGLSVASFQMQHLSLERIVFIGRPDAMFSKLEFSYAGGAAHILSDEGKALIESVRRRAASAGLRTMLVAYLDIPIEEFPGFTKLSVDRVLSERSLVFSALLLVGDGLREDAKISLAEAALSGLKVVVTTEADVEYAESLARALAWSGPLSFVSGKEIDSFTDDQIVRATENGALFVALSSSQKQRIASLLEDAGMSSEVVTSGGLMPIVRAVGEARETMHNIRIGSRIALFIGFLALATSIAASTSTWASISTAYIVAGAAVIGAVIIFLYQTFIFRLFRLKS